MDLNSWLNLVSIVIFAALAGIMSYHVHTTVRLINHVKVLLICLGEVPAVEQAIKATEERLNDNVA